MEKLTEHKRVFEVYAESEIIKIAEKNSKKALALWAFGGRVVKTINFSLVWNPDNFVVKDLCKIDIEEMIWQAYRDGNNYVRVHLAEGNKTGFALFSVAKIICN